MSILNKRLEDNSKSILAGKQINPLKPIKYKLNGIEIRCFEGDTVLSSAIANKITSAGRHKGGELALSETLSLPIYQIKKNAPAGYPKLNDLLPIERTPAINGAKFMTFKGKKYSVITKILSKIKSKPITSLGVDFDKNHSLLNLWHDLKTNENLKTDLLIIGAGVAGLSAATIQAKSNKKTILIEQRAYCGGDAILFGHDAEEADPIDIISAFKKQIKSADNISLITCAKAISIKKNIVKIHLVEIKNSETKSKILEIKANKIIIATGCSDRLPIFAGNRLKGINTLSSSFHLAYGYGVWANDIISKKSTILTTNNIAYRFATLAAESGVKFNKIIDTRVEINSRFMQFAKAYGIKTEIGLKPIKAISQRDELNLDMDFTLNNSFEDSKTHSFEQKSNNIIISGGWVPQLFLWHQAGGQITPTNGSYALKSSGELNNITLAGSCAGWSSTTAAIQSGKNATNILYKRKTIKISDKRIDPLFETMGDNIPISIDIKNSKYPTYLENGQSLICLTNSPVNNIFHKNKLKEKHIIEIDSDKTFSLMALNTIYILGELSATDFAEIALERTVVPKNIILANSNAPASKTIPDNKTIPAKKQKPTENFIEIPKYIQDRFEGKVNLVEISSPNDFLFEIGDLLYPNSDINDPMKSIGVILGHQKNKNIALLSNLQNHKNPLISISGLSGKKVAKVGKIYKK